MTPLVRASLVLRRIVRATHGMAIATALAAYVAWGGARGPIDAGKIVACVLWCLLMIRRARSKIRAYDDVPIRVDIELGALTLLALDVILLGTDRSLSGPLSPAVYVVIAFIATLSRPAAACITVLWALAVEFGIRRTLLGEHAFEPLALRGAFALAFAILNWAFLRAEALRTRVVGRARIEQELRRLKDDARRYRLVASGDESVDDVALRERIERSSVEEIHQSVHYALDLLKKTLDLHTAILLWMNEAGTHLLVSEVATGEGEIHDAPISVRDGILAAVVERKTRVNLADLRPSYKVPYYPGPCPVGALAAIPVLDEGALRGILAIDRIAPHALSPQEEELAAQAARFCLRAIQNERVFVQLERAKVEQGKLYRAARSLSAALGERAVLEAGVRSAREIASFDLALVTVYDPKTKMHEVSCVQSATGEGKNLVGREFSQNAGLVSMVVENRFPLPYKGEFDPARQMVLSRRISWPDHASLLVLPLVLHERALGTLVLSARRRNVFGDAVRPMLEVLASHLAVSLNNARMVHKLETMATTDGLTGLLNKRAMFDAAAQKIAAATRFGRSLSVVICDIDHFKRVNDTYGHDVGDVVIRALGDILTKQKRATDAVARFGGEEFVILCDETGEPGAMLLAERIRDELKKTVFQTSGSGARAMPVSRRTQAIKGGFQVTCSAGVATFPQAGTTWDSLFKAADEALYASKHAGRDRVTAWRVHKALTASGSVSVA